MVMWNVQEKVDELKRDGFVFFRDFFPPTLARQAHDELVRWYDRDCRHREENDIDAPVHEGPAGKSVKTEPSHLLIDVYGRSPALDQMVDRILTHAQSSAVFRAMIGNNYKFRGYNVRRMTGQHDPGPKHPRATALPHEWHRDSPGEFGIGVFLTDVAPGGNAGTALMAGSHLYPYCPRWNTLFCESYFTGLDFKRRGIKALARFNVFNHRLAKKLMPTAREATGRRGDFFFFLNDTWHGRYPNVHGQESMIVLIGGFPTEFPFPDNVTPPSAEVIQSLPLSIQRGLVPQPANTDRSTVVHWMHGQRRSASPLDLFGLARLERKVANALATAQSLLLLGPRAGRRLFRMVRTEPEHGPANDPGAMKKTGQTSSRKAKAA
jgi:hypothetical protein